MVCRMVCRDEVILICEGADGMHDSLLCIIDRGFRMMIRRAMLIRRGIRGSRRIRIRGLRVREGFCSCMWRRRSGLRLRVMFALRFLRARFIGTFHGELSQWIGRLVEEHGKERCRYDSEKATAQHSDATLSHDYPAVAHVGKIEQ